MSDRDHPFPTTSIDRSQGNLIQRNASQDSMASHPLLSSNQTSVTGPLTSDSPLGPPDQQQEPHQPQQSQMPPYQHPSVQSHSTQSPFNTPRYVPYTPRSRVNPITNTSFAAGSSAHAGGDAATRPQLTSLKGAAQDIGLDLGSVGWVVLEKLVGIHGPADGWTGEGSEWDEIWKVLTVGKATLLLPLEPLNPSERITADFVKDHVVVFDTTPGRSSQFVTLSGLRGILTGDNLALHSSISPASQLFQPLLSPASRASGFSRLPPFPKFVSASSSALWNTDTSITSPSHTTSIEASSIESPNPSIWSASPAPPAGTSHIPIFTLQKRGILPTPSRHTIPIQTSSSSQPKSIFLSPRLGPRSISGSSTTSSSASQVPSLPPAIPTPTQSTTSRLPNPFSSLFGRPTSQPQPQTQPPTVLPRAPSPVPIIRADDAPDPLLSGHADPSDPSDPHGVYQHVDISVFTIQKKIIRRDVGRAMNRLLRAEVKASLTGDSIGAGPSTPIPQPARVPIPGWVVERVHEFTSEWYPIVKGPIPVGSFHPTVNIDASGKGGQGEKGYIANMAEETPEEAVDRVQDFYAWLEEDLERIEGDGGFKRKWRDASTSSSSGTSAVVAGMNDGPPTSQAPGEENPEKTWEAERRAEEASRKIREIVEAVERTICHCFYDRLFMLPTSDDAAHDDALSSRIAALNILDLGLEHLDVVVADDAKDGVAEVLRSCGEILGQLDGAYSPVEKLAVIVQAHKVVVDGLTKLPPVHLKSDEEKQAERAKRERGQSSGRQAQVERGSSEKVAHDAAQQQNQPNAGGNSTSNDEKSDPPAPRSLADPPPRTESSLDKNSPPAQKLMKPTPVSGDVLLPMIIYAVVKSNPRRLLSNLFFTQRFRNQSMIGAGEESYCVINLMAVAEFLENVDLDGFGLEGRGKIITAEDLKPVPVLKSPKMAGRSLSPVPSSSSGGQPAIVVEGGSGLGAFRGKVEQQVDALAGSANKVLTGVVGSSVGLLRAILPGQASPDVQAVSPNMDVTQGAAPWNAPARSVSAFGLLRRGGESAAEGLSTLASIAASLPGVAGSVRAKAARANPNGVDAGAKEEVGQQMVTVSRPASVRIRKRSSRSSVHYKVDEIGGGMETDDDSLFGGGSDAEHDTSREITVDAGRGLPGPGQDSDSRSLLSFENMLKDGKRTGTLTPGGVSGSLPRKSLSDRLANASGLKNSTPASSRPGSPAPTLAIPVPGQGSVQVHHPTMRLPPPNSHFLECSVEDLRLSEVAELLREYRRLVEGVRAVGLFEE